MNANPDEAGDIVAKHYNLDKEVARSAVRSLVASKTRAFPIGAAGSSISRA